MSKEKIKARWLFFGKDKYTYDTIDELVNKSMGLAVGEVVTLNGYYSADDGATHKRVIVDTDDGSGVQLKSGLWANLLVPRATKGIIGKFNGIFPLDYALEGEVYLHQQTDKFYICKSSYAGKILNDPDDNYFKELSVLKNSIEIPLKIDEYNQNATQKINEFNISINNKKEELYVDLESKATVEGNKVIEQVKNIVAGNPATTNALTLSGKTRTEFEQDIEKVRVDLSKDLDELGKKNILGISLKSSYQDDDTKVPMNNDWVYTCGDWSQISPKTKKVIMDIYSNGGTGTIYITDPQNITRFVETYLFKEGINHVEIDVSKIASSYKFMKINIYSDTIGAFTSQSRMNNLFVNGDPFTFYSAFNNKDLNTYFTLEPYPTYWEGNIKTNKTYPCIDIYHEEEIMKHKKGLIIVAKDGTGDYETINEAVRNAGDIGSPTTILIREGVYDEVVYLRNRHEISLVGVNRDKCIIKNTTGQYAYSPVMVNGNFEIRNLTIRMEEQGFFPTYEDNVFATYPGYALHIDGNSKDITKQSIGRVSNCTLYSEAFPAVGMGVNQNQKIIFENCEMIRNCTKDYFKKDNWKGAIVCHSSNYPIALNQKFEMINCVLKSNYGMSGNIRGELGDSKEFEVLAINNTMYSEERGLNSFEYIKGQSKLSPISHGNTSDVLNFK